MSGAQRAAAIEFLETRGAGRLPHPGGTLLSHSLRVAQMLESWAAVPTLIAAGLCHSAFGTIGFPHPLVAVDRRSDLTAVIGREAEALVYAYCGDDRAMGLTGSGSDASLRDRFTGTYWMPSEAQRRALVELSTANELDVLRHAELSYDERGALLDLLMACRPRLSPAAAASVATALLTK